MKPHPRLRAFAASLLGLAGPSHAALIPGDPNNDLIYVPVKQCRLIDTRNSSSGNLVAGVTQNFLAYGSVASQGGNASGCPQPKETGGPSPVAMAANITAVGTGASGDGNIKAFASDGASATALSLVNFKAGTNIANAATIPLCKGASCPGGTQLSLVSGLANVPAVVDVLGYFYPISTNVVRVALSGGDFTDPLKAMEYLTTVSPAPSATNPWVVEIGPGTFELGATPLNLSLPGVTVRGAGAHRTTLNGDGGGSLTDATVTMTNGGTRLEDLTVTTTSGSNAERYAITIALPTGSTGSSPTLNRVHVEATGGSSSNWGVYTFSDLPVEIIESELTADGEEAVGLVADGTPVSMRQDSLAEGLNGGAAGSRGVQLVQQATLTIRGSRVNATAGATPDFAVAADVGTDCTLDAEDSTFTASGGSASIGVFAADPSSVSAEATLVRSTMTGASSAVSVATGSSVRIGGSRLDGTATNTGGTLQCVLSRSAVFTALDSACQPVP